ncbi:MAG: hypothetical protein PHY48_14010 [Candidatus Cloacimonetes bacterium]|nr:hypothetical protein [Candidatus Cloacimonadota bacterium]
MSELSTEPMGGFCPAKTNWLKRLAIIQGDIGLCSVNTCCFGKCLGKLENALVLLFSLAKKLAKLRSGLGDTLF